MTTYDERNLALLRREIRAVDAMLSQREAELMATLTERDKLRADLATMTAERDEARAALADHRLGASRS